MQNINKNNGFTLAEVLITLGIIGVVAAITIPTIMNSIQDEQYKTAYKKAYAIISQALLKAQNDNAIIALTGTNSAVGAEANFAALKSQFIIAKECDVSSLSNCWDQSTGSESWGSESNSVPSFIDNSGMAWRLREPDSAAISPVILVDTNGNKKPNKYGQDRFPFLFGAGAQRAWGVADFGIPTKIVPYDDVTSSIDNGNCRSYATHPCYNRRWLYGAN